MISNTPLCHCKNLKIYSTLALVNGGNVSDLVERQNIKKVATRSHMSHGAKEQAQFHVMTNNPTKYENILLNDFREVAFTKCHGQTETIYYVIPSQNGMGQ